LFNVVAGVHEPTNGTVYLDGENITGLPPHELFHKGMLRTFQIAHEFSSLSVRENLMMVPGEQPGERLWDVWFNASKVSQTEKAVQEKADEVIDFLQISHVADELAGNLSGGQKKLLELGRTMMVDAKVVFSMKSVDIHSASLSTIWILSTSSAIRLLSWPKVPCLQKALLARLKLTNKSLRPIWVRALKTRQQRHELFNC